jgi:ABC-type uncharacterized transport system permease subunit
MTELFVAAALLYGLAGALSLGFLAGFPESTAPWARRSLVAAFVVHTCELGARGVAGLHPVSSARETVGFIAWVLVGAFLLVQLRRRLDAVAAFVAPVALVLLIAARLSPSPAEATAGLGVLGRIHISLAAAGIAIFALATASSILYLVEERQLKQKRLGAIVKKGSALETLDRLAHRCVQVGFPIFTVAMVTGAIWSAQRAAGLRPEYPIAFFAWTAFAAVLIARTTAGWRGRRSAALTIVGFCAALAVLGVYLVRALGA